jgi:primosomal protein N' (replication factor Y)
LAFREQLKYPPASRVALLTLKGRSEDKVKFSADHLKRELEKATGPAAGPGSGGPGPAFKDLIIAGPAPAPLLKAETYYRYQIMLRTRAMSRLSQTLAKMVAALSLPEDVTLTVDIDPVNLS